MTWKSAFEKPQQKLSNGKKYCYKSLFLLFQVITLCRTGEINKLSKPFTKIDCMHPGHVPTSTNISFLIKVLSFAVVYLNRCWELLWQQFPYIVCLTVCFTYFGGRLFFSGRFSIKKYITVLN